MSHAMQVLALLEERPFHARELAAVQATPQDAIQATLVALRNAGSVKTVGSAKKWTLIATPKGQPGRPATSAAGGPPSGASSTPDPDLTILALLQQGPQSLGAIGEAVQLSHSPVFRRLQKMRARGEVKSFGLGRFTKWALPDYVPPPPAPKPTRHAGAKPSLRGEPGWWTTFAAPGSDRAAFSEEVARRHEQRLNAQAGMSTVPVADDTVLPAADTPDPNDDPEDL